MTPAEEADRSTLIRRVTYDLTGMPPDAERSRGVSGGHIAERVRKSCRPSAGQSALRRTSGPLLAGRRALRRHSRCSPDNFRRIWPYRDYVIKSYNQNKPFDQFVKEQLAGDMMPAKNLDTLVASAFLRAGISSGEGGTLIEELRVNNKRERAEAFGAAFLGLTTGCAVCHDHKFDPTTQKDFYQLTAFFNNLTENPSNDDRNDWPPFIRVPKEHEPRGIREGPCGTARR